MAQNFAKNWHLWPFWTKHLHFWSVLVLCPTKNNGNEVHIYFMIIDRWEYLKNDTVFSTFPIFIDRLSLFPLRLLLLPVCIVLTKIPIISPWTDRMALSTLTSEKFWHIIALHYQQKYLYFPFLFLLRQISI